MADRIIYSYTSILCCRHADSVTEWLYTIFDIECISSYFYIQPDVAIYVVKHYLIFFAEKWIQCDSTVSIIPNESEDDEDELAGDDPDDQGFELSGSSTWFWDVPKRNWSRYIYLIRSFIQFQVLFSKLYFVLRIDSNYLCSLYSMQCQMVFPCFADRYFLEFQFEENVSYNIWYLYFCFQCYCFKIKLTWMKLGNDLLPKNRLG